MATVASLIQRVRRRVRDWPERDTMTASISSSGTTFTVTDVDSVDGPRYFEGGVIEIENELLRVTSINTGTNTLTVMRGLMGSTAATHASGSTILFNPAFSAVAILDLLNDGLDALWPYFYQQVLDTSLNATSGTYEYTVPTVSGLSIPIPRIHRIEVKPSGFTDYLDVRRWEIIRGVTPKLKFLSELGDNTNIRVHGYAPLPHVVVSDSTHAQLPYNADNLAVLYAVSDLLYSGDSGRTRFDRGPIDSREQANRPGDALKIAREWERRFYQRVEAAAMPPMGHAIATVM